MVVASTAPKLRLCRAIWLLLLAWAGITNSYDDAGGVIPALDILKAICLTGVACVTSHTAINISHVLLVQQMQSYLMSYAGAIHCHAASMCCQLALHHPFVLPVRDAIARLSMACAMTWHWMRMAMSSHPLLTREASAIRVFHLVVHFRQVVELVDADWGALV